MWDNLIVVLTHIHGNVQCEQFGPAREWIGKTLPELKREWVSSLSAQFEAARMRWVDKKNMVFTIDSEVLRGDGSEHVELVPISDLVQERKVSKDLHHKFPDQVFFKGTVRQCPTVMDLQWKDSALSALREHSLLQMEDLREHAAMNAKEDYYVAISGGLQTDDVHIGTEFLQQAKAQSQHIPPTASPIATQLGPVKQQLHSAGSTTSMDWQEPVKPQLHSAGSITSMHWEEPIKQQLHSAGSITSMQWHQPNAKQVEASPGTDFLGFGSVLRNMTSCSSGHCVQMDQEVARHDHHNSAC